MGSYFSFYSRLSEAYNYIPSMPCHPVVRPRYRAVESNANQFSGSAQRSADRLKSTSGGMAYQSAGTNTKRSTEKTTRQRWKVRTRTVPPPLREVVRVPRRAEHREVEDERDDLRTAVQRRSNDIAAKKKTRNRRRSVQTPLLLSPHKCRKTRVEDTMADTHLYLVNQRG